MTDEKQKIDPRYDAAFQRGFEGQVRSGSHADAVVRRSALVSSRSYRSGEPAPDFAEQDEQRAEGESDQNVPESGLHHETAGGLSVAPQPTPRHSVTMRDLLRNPFLVVLVVLGLALTIGGIAWANQARMAVGSVATELDYWYLQVSVVGVPATILTGVTMLAGVLFVAAVTWNRR